MPVGITRPRYHLSTRNWMSDPIPFYFGETWHVFYEHNPSDPNWGRVHWGHASSVDLLDWHHHPIALSPSDGFDQGGGTWAGSVVPSDSGFHAFYTGTSTIHGGVEVQCVAVSQDLDQWLRLPQNPIIVSPPMGYGPCFRNPHVFHEDGVWKMLVGSQKVGAGGSLLLYESPDLANWDYVGVALQGQVGDLGFDFESPDLFSIGDRWVLLTSRGAVHWMVGDWDGRRFYPHRRGTCDGPEFTRFTFDASPYYAAKTAAGPHGRRVMFGWVRETQDLEGRTWSGLLATPRELSILEDGSLGMRPVSEFRRLRKEHVHLEPKVYPARERTRMPEWDGTCKVFTLRTDGDLGFSIIVRADEYGRGTEIRYDAETRTLGGAPVGDGPVEVEVFVDGSVIEAFVSGRGAVTCRSYAPEENHRAFFVAGRLPTRLEWQHVWNPCG